MKKSTFRIVKSAGMFLFLLLFGVFVYAIIRAQHTERTDLAYSPESDTQDSDTFSLPDANKPIGFEYQNTPIEEV